MISGRAFLHSKKDKNRLEHCGPVTFVRPLSIYYAFLVQQQDGTHGHCRGVWPLVLALLHGPQGSGINGGKEGGGKDARRNVKQAKDQDPRRKHRGAAQPREPYTHKYSGECVPPPPLLGNSRVTAPRPPLCYLTVLVSRTCVSPFCLTNLSRRSDSSQCPAVGSHRFVSPLRLTVPPLS